MCWIKALLFFSLGAVGLVVLGACGPTPEPVVFQETDAGTGMVVAVENAMATTAEPSKPGPSDVVLTQTPPAEPERAGLWYPLAGDPKSLDQHADNTDREDLIIGQCIEGLFEYRSDGSIAPAGATGYEISDDGRVYTIKLREDAVWSDGEPVVAQHYVDGVIYILEWEGEFWYLNAIEGAAAYDTGEASDPATVGVRAMDDYTLEIRLAEPVAHFAALLPFLTFYPRRLDVTETHGDQWMEPGNYVSNGAYLLDEWVHGEKVVLVKNPDYWNADQVTIEQITFYHFPDPLASYENDELHVLAIEGLWDEETIEHIQADPVLSREVRTVPQAFVRYVGLNTLRPPTDDVRVRKALALAVDHEAFKEVALVQGWLPASCIIPPTIMGHQPYGTCGYTHDPEQARALLAEAGYPDGQGFPTLHLWSHQSDWNEGANRVLVAKWQETLGITTEVHNVDWDTLSDYWLGCSESPEALAACELNAYQFNWMMDYGDPQNILELVFDPDSWYHITGWQSARFEELLALAETEYDPAQREAYFMEADRILVEEQVAVLPIMYMQDLVLIKEGISFEYQPFVGPPLFKYWTLP